MTKDEDGAGPFAKHDSSSTSSIVINLSLFNEPPQEVACVKRPGTYELLLVTAADTALADAGRHGSGASFQDTLESYRAHSHQATRIEGPYIRFVLDTRRGLLLYNPGHDQ